MKRKTVCAVVFLICAGAWAAAATSISPSISERLRRPRQRTLASAPSRTLNNSAARGPRPRAVAPPTLPAASTKVGFLTVASIPTGPFIDVFAAALGDFNGDGKQDVAGMSQDLFGPYRLSILVSNGDGTFASPVSTPVPFSGNDLIATADLNGDGKCDVILVHPNSIDVLLGDGTSNFAAPVNYPYSVQTPVAVAIAAVNGDHNLDIVVADGTADVTGGSPVATFRGDGTGGFGVATISHYPGAVSSGALVDVNGDGHLDLISQSQYFLGSSGDFSAPVALSSAPACQSQTDSVAVADVNHDGVSDIVTADCANGTITVFLGNGSGSFGTGRSFPAGHIVGAVALADMNGDGKLDAVVSDFYSYDVMVLPGNGDGTFSAPTIAYPLGGEIWSGPLIADFNGDARPDIVIPSAVYGEWFSLQFLANIANGTFAGQNDYFYPNAAPGSVADAYGLASADLNGDGLPDFVVGNFSDDATIGVTVFLSDRTTKTLHYAANYGSGGDLEYVALADVDGDGKLDLIASELANTVGNILIFLGNGDGTFQSVPTIIPVTSVAGLGQLVVGDFDGNHKPDIAVLDVGIYSPDYQSTTGNVWVLLNNSTVGSPSFSSPVSYALTNPGWEIATADLGNGFLDLAITQIAATQVSVLMGNGTGVFTALPDFDLGSADATGIALGPTVAGGVPDMVVTIGASSAGMGVAVASGNGDGTFGTPVLYPATPNLNGMIIPYPGDVRIADLDGDGNPDLIFTNSGDGMVGVLYGTGLSGPGQSRFYEPIEFPTNDYPLTLLVEDINGDGALDAVVSSNNYSGVTTLLNTGANQVTVTSSVNPSTIGQNVAFTATVTAKPVPGGPVNMPTGTITFYDGSVALSTVPLSGGQATYTTHFAGQGTNLILPIYSGDTNLVSNTQATLVQNVNKASGSPRYNLAATPTSATVLPGHSAQFTVTATPVGGDTETVIFSCPSLPGGVTGAFSPASVTLNGSSPSSVTLTVTVAPSFVALNTPPLHESPSPIGGIVLSVFCCVGLAGRRASVRAKLTPILLMIVLALVLVATGCGGSSGGTGTPPQSSSQLIHVLATGGGQSSAQELNITIIIQQ